MLQCMARSKAAAGVFFSEEELWISFARDAMANYETADPEDNEDLVDDMVEVASDYADAMLDEYNERFGSKTSGRRRKTKRAKADDDED